MLSLFLLRRRKARWTNFPFWKKREIYQLFLWDVDGESEKKMWHLFSEEKNQQKLSYYIPGAVHSDESFQHHGQFICKPAKPIQSNLLSTTETWFSTFVVEFDPKEECNSEGNSGQQEVDPQKAWKLF